MDLSIERPNCSRRMCLHYRGISQPSGMERGGELAVCDAYPNGIPDDIAYGDDLHLTPRPGDNGIQYEPIEEE